MKTCVAIALCLLCAALGADDRQARREAVRNQAILATGGFVERAARGKVAIVDMQKRVSPEAIQESIESLTKILRVNLAYEAAESRAFEVKNRKLPSDAQFAVYVIDDGDYPLTLVAAEAGWGVVNTRQLTAARFKPAFQRAVALALGGGVGLFRQNPTLSVRTAFDLDAFAEDALSIDAINAIVRNLENAGVSPKRTVSYRTACKEGWAPEPENEVQKAIWDQFHELPSKPITIEFDPAKGK